MSTEKDKWEYFGKNDPYFAVATYDKFKSENLTEELKDDFFQLGKDQVDKLWSEIESAFGEFSPKRALDFGCGVGRIVVPMAGKADHVTGVDISEHMIGEAVRNCENRGLGNTAFLQTDDFMDQNLEKFDFVHSSIVFQHIEPTAGMTIFRRILSLLDDGGIGALQFAVSDLEGNPLSKTFTAYRDFPALYKLRNKVKGAKDEPLIPMYLYDLNQIAFELYRNGCHDIRMRFYDHGLLGVMLIFRRRELEAF